MLFKLKIKVLFFLFIFIISLFFYYFPEVSYASEAYCPPTKDRIYINYSNDSWGAEITNYGGAYDPASYGQSSFIYDYSRQCRVSPIVKLIIDNNGKLTELPVTSSGLSYKDQTYDHPFESNCWRIARVSDYGQSEWSNQVCYVPPLLCPPTSDKLYLYDDSIDFLSIHSIRVTNHGGSYYSPFTLEKKYDNRCNFSNLTKIIVDTNGVLTEYPAIGTGGSFDINYTDINKSNCWRIARVSDYGQSEWSNQVCYQAPPLNYNPAKSKIITKTITKKIGTGYRSSYRTGAVCRDGWLSSATGSGACSWHGGVSYWTYSYSYSSYYTKKVKQDYKCFQNIYTKKYTEKCKKVG